MHFQTPKKKFNKEAAERVWAMYTERLLSGIQQTETEGLQKGMSSYEIERLWQHKAEQQRKKAAEENEPNEKQ